MLWSAYLPHQFISKQKQMGRAKHSGQLETRALSWSSIKTYPSSVFRELFFVRQLWLHHYSLCFHLCNLITYLLVSCKNPSLSKPFNLLISFHIRCHIMPFPSSTVHHNCNKHVEINRKLVFFPKCLFIWYKYYLSQQGCQIHFMFADDEGVLLQLH